MNTNLLLYVFVILAAVAVTLATPFQYDKFGGRQGSRGGLSFPSTPPFNPQPQRPFIL